MAVWALVAALHAQSASAPRIHVRLAAVRRPSESPEILLPRRLALRDLTATLSTDPAIVINSPGQPYAHVTVAIESVTQDMDWVVTASVRPYQAKPIPFEGRGASMTLAVQYLAEALETWLHAAR